MPSVQYGERTIEFSILEKRGLKSHYISVQKGEGVILKGEPLSLEKSQALILKKARWIIEKLELVKSIAEDDIVTGSRIQYLGRRYYVEVFSKPDISEVRIDFTHSKFKVVIPDQQDQQANIKAALENFFRSKAQEKIAPRVRKLSKETGLSYQQLKFRKLEKRWGSCTPQNNIIINIDAIKLPFSLIDYLIVHELVHTKIKNHSRAFWAELSKHAPNWKELDERLYWVRV
ncbi:MAG: SprT family zinc-dependent metalloprotease [Bacteroidota bacterium]